jgi:iron(III) transport system substrate-binding protein
VLDQALGGQFPIALQIFNDQAAFSKAKGAPVDWVALQPVYAQLSRISLAKSPPHPGAAMLFLDFMFSKAGQDIIRAGGGIPGRPDVDAEVATLKPNAGGFKAQYIDPDQVYRDTSKWTDLYKKLFM